MEITHCSEDCVFLRSILFPEMAKAHMRSATTVIVLDIPHRTYITVFFVTHTCHMLTGTQEGEAFLESKGMKVTDDDAKTRSQKEKLEEITNDTSDKPKLPREGTMAVTAKVWG